MRQANPAMLLIAREMRGLTQTALAKMSGIGQGKISRYENGEIPLSGDDVQALSEALGFPVDFFYRAGQRHQVDVGAIFHRKRHSLPAVDEKRLDSQLSKLRLDIEELLSNVDLANVRYSIPQYRPSEFSGSIADIARQLRTDWEMPTGPVRNLVRQLERASCFIFVADFGTDKMDEVVQWTPPIPPVFLVNKHSPSDRVRFSLAHALGHLIMHFDVPSYEGMEEEADTFASAFLMPEEDIRPHLAPVTIEHMLQLKPVWKVSMQALIRRAHDIGEITDRRYTSLFQMLSRYGYRKQEPIDIEPERPKLIHDLLNAYKEEGYSNADLAKLTTMYTQDFRALYYPEVGLVA